MEAANVLDEKAVVALIDPQHVALIAELLKAEDSESAEARAAEALIADRIESAGCEASVCRLWFYADLRRVLAADRDRES